MLVEVSTNLALQMSSIFVFKESPRLQAGEDVNSGAVAIPHATHSLACGSARFLGFSLHPGHRRCRAQSVPRRIADKQTGLWAVLQDGLMRAPAY